MSNIYLAGFVRIYKKLIKINNFHFSIVFNKFSMALYTLLCFLIVLLLLFLSQLLFF